MKITGFGVLAMLLMAQFSFAQNNLDEELNTELDQMYSQTAHKQAAPQVQVNVQSKQDQASPLAQAQKQPTTVIEASPLTESRAEKLRRARQDQELQTEQKIVEKLETSRMEDEKKRSDVLFGGKFDQLNNGQPQAAPVAVAPVQEVAVAPAPAAKDPGMDKDAVRGEVSAALAEMKEKEEAEKAKSQWYAAGLVGYGDYPNAKNIKGEYAAGVSIGKTFQENLAFEGSFLYSKYSVEQVNRGGYTDPLTGKFYPAITDMDQYNSQALLKYSMFDGSVRPVMGALLSYTYRSFTDKQFAVYNNDATSDALDFGLMGGVDVRLTEKFTLGLDGRYFWNLTSKTSESFQKSFVYQQQNQGHTAVEKLNYWTMGLVARTSF